MSNDPYSLSPAMTSSPYRSMSSSSAVSISPLLEKDPPPLFLIPTLESPVSSPSIDSSSKKLGRRRLSLVRYCGELKQSNEEITRKRKKKLYLVPQLLCLRLLFQDLLLHSVLLQHHPHWLLPPSCRRRRHQLPQVDLCGCYPSGRRVPPHDGGGRRRHLRRRRRLTVHQRRPGVGGGRGNAQSVGGGGVAVGDGLGLLVLLLEGLQELLPLLLLLLLLKLLQCRSHRRLVLERGCKPPSRGLTRRAAESLAEGVGQGGGLGLNCSGEGRSAAELNRVSSSLFRRR